MLSEIQQIFTDLPNRYFGCYTLFLAKTIYLHILKGL